MEPFYPKFGLDQPAHPRGVRPGVEPAAGAVCALGDRQLFDRRPVVGPATMEQVVRRVALPEAPVHLEPAPVGIARVAPGALVAVDAEPRALVRRVQVRAVRTARRALGDA